MKFVRRHQPTLIEIVAQHLLDFCRKHSIGHGNRDFKIHKEYSKACELFFKGKIEELDALELLFGNASNKELFDMMFYPREEGPKAIKEALESQLPFIQQEMNRLDKSAIRKRSRSCKLLSWQLVPLL